MNTSSSISKRAGAVRTLPAALHTPTPAFPRSAKVELTARCDLQCVFCAAQNHPRSGEDMSPYLYRQIASRLRHLGVTDLGLFYIGESFLCDWLPEAIAYAKKVCGYPRAFLTTNGLSATPERVRECLAAGLDSLKFAFNWADPEQFEDVTGRSGRRYSTILEHLAAARRIRDEHEKNTGHRCTLTASTVVYDENQQTRMAHALAAINPLVDEHYWLPLFGRCVPRDALPAHTAAARKPLPCATLFTELHVTHDGHLSACSLDGSPRFHIGNLKDDSVGRLWHSAAFQRLRRAHLKGDVRGTVCEKCIGYT